MAASDGQNAQVIATKQAGLRNCRIFSKRTPSDVLQCLGSLAVSCSFREHVRVLRPVFDSLQAVCMTCVCCCVLVQVSQGYQQFISRWQWDYLSRKIGWCRRAGRGKSSGFTRVHHSLYSLPVVSAGLLVSNFQIYAQLTTPCQAWRSYMERHGMSARTAGRDQLVDFIETSEFKEACLQSSMLLLLLLLLLLFLFLQCTECQRSDGQVAVAYRSSHNPSIWVHA